MNNFKVMEIKLKDCILRRITYKVWPTISGWDIISLDKKVRIGVIYQFNTVFIKKKVGAMQYSTNYWHYERFWDRMVGTAKTRKSVIEAFFAKVGTVVN